MTEYARTAASAATVLQAQGNFAIHGGPGSGKSHLLRNISADLLQSSNFCLIALDMSTCSSGGEAFAELARGLAKRGRSGRSRKWDGAKDVRAGWSSLAAVAREAGPVCLVLDEFDAVVRYEDADMFIRLLRELLQRPRESQICALVGSRRTLRVIEDAVRGVSTLEGVFTPACVSTLEIGDIAVGWGLGSLSRDEFARLLDWSGGVPRLVDAYVATVLREEMSEGHAETRRQEWLVRQLDYLETVGLGAAAAQFVLGPRVRPLWIERARLQAIGVLDAPGAVSGGAGSLEHFEFFVRGLEARYRSTLSAWGPLATLEISVRRFSRALLRACGVALSDGRVTAPHDVGVGRLLGNALSRVRQRGIEATDLSVVVTELGKGDHWTLLEAVWEFAPRAVTDRGVEYWATRLARCGGVSRAPGEFWDVDEVEVLGWAQDVDAATDLMQAVERPSERDHPPGATGSSAQQVTVRAARGAVVTVGSNVQTAGAAEASKGPIGRRGVLAFIGWFAGIAGAAATIATLIYYVIDRSPK